MIAPYDEDPITCPYCDGVGKWDEEEDGIVDHCRCHHCDGTGILDRNIDAQLLYNYFH